jgi:hypothetical protein
MHKYYDHSKGKSKAGLTVHLIPDENTEPLELTFIIKCPESNVIIPEDTTSLSAEGKLTLSLGKKGYITFFADGVGTFDDDPPEPRGKI